MGVLRLLRIGAVILLPLISLTACEALPRDPEKTLASVRGTGEVRVGLTPMNPSDKAHAEKLLAVVTKRTSAMPRISFVAAEPGLSALDEGRLDLVIGPFAKDSPWATDVAFGPPIARSGSKDHPIELKAAMRNGENRWIMLVEDASREAAPEIANQ